MLKVTGTLAAIEVIVRQGRSKLPVTVRDIETARVLCRDSIDLFNADQRDGLLDTLPLKYIADVTTIVDTMLDRLSVATDKSSASLKVDTAEAVALPPEPPPHDTPVDGQELLAEIESTIRRYVSMPDEGIVAAALWIILAYSYEAVYTLPQLAIVSPTRECGKTTLLTVVKMLVPKPLFTANISEAAIYNTVEAWKPTLLIDEADTFIDKSDSMRGVLNSGYTPDEYVVRMKPQPDGSYVPGLFSARCPKALARIGQFADTITSRSVVIHLRPPRRSERLADLADDYFDDQHGVKRFLGIRRKLIRWATDNIEQLRQTRPVIPVGLYRRVKDNWRPLFAIADLLGPDAAERAREVALTLKEVKRDDPSTALTLLSDLRDMFAGNQTDRLKSSAVALKLMDREDRPWCTMSDITLVMRKMAMELYALEAGPRVHRFGEITARGYLLSDCQDAFDRYLEPLDSSTTGSDSPEGEL